MHRLMLLVMLSLAASLVAIAVGERRFAAFVVAAAAIVSALGVIGHLVTLDDDARGGWSNPDGEHALWRRSLLELGIKILAFAASCTLLLWLLLHP
jgi:hypothetical protein